jgi:hypothetical protein
MSHDRFPDNDESSERGKILAKNKSICNRFNKNHLSEIRAGGGERTTIQQSEQDSY